MLLSELDVWHRYYLPLGGLRGKTVLDLGAGNGETAQFYLNHGASRVICVEPDARLLRENFGSDPRVTIVDWAANFIKCDIEGAEKDMVIETHFQPLLKLLHTFPVPNANTTLWKLVELKQLTFLFSKLQGIFPQIHQMRIQAAHFIRRLIEVI